MRRGYLLAVAIASILSVTLMGCSDNVALEAPQSSAELSGTGWSCPGSGEKENTDVNETTSTSDSVSQSENDPHADDAVNDMESYARFIKMVDEDWKARKDRDDAMISQALRSMLTWENKNQYHAARDEFKNGVLGKDANPMVLKEFLPEEYKSGANLHYDGMDSYVLNESDGMRGDVEYVTIINASAKGKNDTIASGELIASYTVGADGTVSGFDIVTVN